MYHAKLLRAKVKNNILKAAREERHIIFKEETIRQLDSCQQQQKKLNEMISLKCRGKSNFNFALHT